MSYQERPAEDEKRVEEKPPKTRCSQEEEDQVFVLLKGELTEWERKFCTTLEKYKWWSEKQRALFDKIKVRYLGEQPKKAEPETTTDEEWF